ncbi:MAG: LptF/LptG family permease [Candidatus Melainabacteria bacterium]|nr:LptF/LptG family permease [Candidatus Melainabacteria bacterium]
MSNEALVSSAVQTPVGTAQHLKPKMVFGFRWTLLDRYLVGEMALGMLFGLLLFTVIWLAPETLFDLVQNVFFGKLTVSEGVQLLLYHIPAVLQQSMPMAALIASVFLFRRLSHTFESVALFAAGIGLLRLLVPVALVGLVFATAHALLQEGVSPVVGPRLERIQQVKGLKNRPDSNFVFLERDSRQPSQLDKFFMIGTVDEQTLSDFLILYYLPPPARTKASATAATLSTPASGQIHRILTARRGRWDAQHRAWRLENGYDYELDAEGVYRDVRPFKEQWVHTSPYPVSLLSFNRRNPKWLDWNALGEYINLLYATYQAQDARYYEMRRLQKLAFPVATVVFAVLGALLGLEPPRARKLYGLTMAAVALFLYVVLTPFVTNLGSLGVLPAWLAAWLPLLATVLLVLGMVRLRRL